MHKHLAISNYKSIRELRLDCKKINVFIGEPNAGKSNLIEAISLLSDTIPGLKDLCRFRTLSDLFFDNQTGQSLHVRLDHFFSEIHWSSYSITPFTFLTGEHMMVKFETHVDLKIQKVIRPLLSGFRTNVSYYKFNPEGYYSDPIPVN